jgi:hypothetical protein
MSGRLNGWGQLVQARSAKFYVDIHCHSPLVVPLLFYLRVSIAKAGLSDKFFISVICGGKKQICYLSRLG